MTNVIQFPNPVTTIEYTPGMGLAFKEEALEGTHFRTVYANLVNDCDVYADGIALFVSEEDPNAVDIYLTFGNQLIDDSETIATCGIHLAQAVEVLGGKVSATLRPNLN